MEEGSLVQEALHTIQQSRENGGSLRNRLIVDLFLIQEDLDRIQSFQTLVSLCSSVNDSFAALTQNYPWFSGGDVPLFGVQVTDGVPHLRGSCSYGPSVSDEWAMIGAVMEISRHKLNTVMIKLWDADDGQILLIESAMVLPEWVDEIGPVACEHRCWVVQGKVTLIRPNLANEPLSLKDAIQCIREKKLTQRLSSVQAAVEKRLAPFDFALKNPWKDVSHRTSIVLPRQIAFLLHKFPTLLQCSVASFERFSYSKSSLGKLDFDDLVWTTHRMGRTSFALLRSLQTPEWDSEDHIPDVYKSVEVNRMKRTCQVESTPHLQNALQLGLRITAGLDYILRQPSAEHGTEILAENRILQHWTDLDVACGGDGTWLREAWIAGPNQSPIDLSGFISCPIESVDIQEAFPFPRTHPRKTLKAFVQQNLGKEPTEEPIFIIPGPDEVDDEHWMHLKGDEQELGKFLQPQALDEEPIVPTEEHASNKAEPLDDFLDNFATFVEKESDAKGVVTKESADVNLDEPVTIDPKLFLNLLHKVLSSTPEEISNLTTEDDTEDDSDPYFGSEDYDITEEDEGENEIRAMMDAMDLELRMKSKTNEEETEDIEDQRVAQDAQVLSGLIESLDASEGAAGPVRNILREMSK
jgi:hypothetical protein